MYSINININDTILNITQYSSFIENRCLLYIYAEDIFDFIKRKYSYLMPKIETMSAVSYNKETVELVSYAVPIKIKGVK